MKNERKSQVSVGLTKDEKSLLLKTSFKQNRSVSQVMRFAVKNYLDKISAPHASHLEANSVEDTFSRLALQIARNADILNTMEVILIEGKILDKKLPFQISYFSDNVGKISGYDRYDLLDQDFLKSRIHPEERKESLFHPSDQSKWEKTFRFKKPDGRYAHTRVSFRIMDEINLLGIWQFI